MKWYHWVIVVILLLGTVAVYFYDLSTINTLKARITALEARRDTFYVEGTKDTVYIKKFFKDTVIAYNDKSIDTTLEMIDHTVQVSGIDSLLVIGLECRKPETFITRIDTIYKIKEILKEVEVSESFNYKDFGLGALTGISTILLIITLIGE